MVVVEEQSPVGLANSDFELDLEDLYNDEELDEEDIKPFPDWPTHEGVGLVDPNFTFRRVEMYGENGR